MRAAGVVDIGAVSKHTWPVAGGRVRLLQACESNQMGVHSGCKMGQPEWCGRSLCVLHSCRHTLGMMHLFPLDPL